MIGSLSSLSGSTLITAGIHGGEDEGTVLGPGGVSCHGGYSVVEANVGGSCAEYS